MTEKEAIILLANYNDWRRGEEGISQPDPKTIGIAISTVIDHWKKRNGYSLDPQEITETTTETPVSDFLIEKSTFVRWMRERDEISRETADGWMIKFYNQAKEIELKQK